MNPYLSESKQARVTGEETARQQIRFIMSNIRLLDNDKRSKAKSEAARDFERLLSNGIKLTGPQLSYIDGIYEKVMELMGYESVKPQHRNPRRTALRYGK